MKVIFIALSLVLFAGTGCKETWTAFYYPNGCLHCEEDWIIEDKFSSLEACRDWVDAQMLLSGNPNDDYECGSNCKWDGSFYVCKETIK